MSGEFLTLALVILFIALMVVFYFRNRKREGRFLRDIPAF
jgi:cbb3-type cytochrome oxidase subunit 3